MLELYCQLQSNNAKLTNNTEFGDLSYRIEIFLFVFKAANIRSRAKVYEHFDSD